MSFTEDNSQLLHELNTDPYQPLFTDPESIQLLSRLPEAFDGATCAEVEDRYLNLLDYINGTYPSSDVLENADVQPRVVFVVGQTGRDYYDLPVEDQERFTKEKSANKHLVALPILELESEQIVLDIDGKQCPPTEVLVKNPYSRIRGETFPMVPASKGGYESPLIIGVQNGLVLIDGRLMVVEGKKNKDTQNYEWKIKRPAFDNGKYEKLDVIKAAIEQRDLTVLRKRDIN